MKRIMSSIWFALTALLLSLACVIGALHLGRTELWAHGVVKAETAPSRRTVAIRSKPRPAADYLRMRRIIAVSTARSLFFVG